VVTEVTVRILKKPPTARALLIGFQRRRMAVIVSPRSSPPASSGRHGDDGRPAIHAAEDFVHAGYRAMSRRC